ncbi:MAG: hypothetical protein KGL39_48785 [Patescibacteria group bacterium]|nr:hypothetical protein [Patescibacteria group bacterium]
MIDQSKIDLRSQFREIAKEAAEYFQVADQKEPGDSPANQFESYRRRLYWHELPDEIRSLAIDLENKLLPCCAKLVNFANASTLTGSEDVQDLKETTKEMRSALYLREYWYRKPEAVSDDGIVYGFRPGEQSDRDQIDAFRARDIFNNGLSKIASSLKLIEASGDMDLWRTTLSSDTSSKYRSDTAFIMMWMDPDHPELTDVADKVRSIFKAFGIRAVRADDIEHEGQISERVLNEIRTSEFLFGDLTGTRPNVYYEIGYAHALGKRVILFRK